MAAQTVQNGTHDLPWTWCARSGQWIRLFGSLTQAALLASAQKKRHVNALAKSHVITFQLWMCVVAAEAIQPSTKGGEGDFAEAISPRWRFSAKIGFPLGTYQDYPDQQTEIAGRV